jgi:hypothetical protein
MRGRIAVQISLLILAQVVTCPGLLAQSNGYGPEVKSFLDLMRHEDDELEFQIKHNEISRREYLRSKSRIAIHRQTVLNLVKDSGTDYIPELHVAAASELDQLIEDGTSLIKAIKPGDVIKQKWRYLGSVRRGESFYIFERLTVK